VNAYVDGLRLLAGRELSEAQIRQRLARRSHSPADIDDAVRRLLSEGAIDDARTAQAIARREVTVKRRGRLRVRRTIEAAGIAPAVARRVTDTLFADTDTDALIEAALDRRLRPRASIKDNAEYRRLYRAMLAQGFEAEAVLRHLEARRRSPRRHEGTKED
jgi:regulatory protein